jgi:adenosylcobinamide kinase/adenosylcobinamide-phosphate guanylyltransferase
MAAPVSTLVLGGARSGKSSFAERTALASGLHPIYVATATPCDDEFRDRISRHRARRGNLRSIVEEPLAIAETIAREASAKAVVVVDCLTLWLSNLMLAKRDLEAETAALLRAVGAAAGPVILVSNEVGLGIVPETPLGRRFRDEQGRLNQAVAQAVPRVIFMAAGLALELKAAERPDPFTPMSTELHP